MFKTLTRTATRLIRRYPMEAAMTIYNLSVFTWLRTNLDTLVTGITESIKQAASDQLVARGFSAVLLDNVIDTSKSTVEIATTLMQQAKATTWGWLVVSMLLTLASRLVKKTVRNILLGVVLGIGIYLAYSFVLKK